MSRYRAAYTRFTNAGAAISIKDSTTLSAALHQLAAPDRVAQMAAAGWEVASEGAEATDRIIDLLQDMLDLMEAG